MEYLHWLGLVSLAFVGLERWRPARPEQGPLRREILNDLVYVAFNGHLYAVLAGGVVAAFAQWTNGRLTELNLWSGSGWLAGRSFVTQFITYLVVSDFLQWCVHNLLHRVPLLWWFHKVHHSAPYLDWAANFRFHWIEIVVYRSLLYVPLLFLGGDAAPLFAVAVFATAWGHFNHANFRVSLGPLGYVFNSPGMHLWHHDASDEGGAAKNFGIVLSAWDWIFRTAYWPRDRAPARIGYPADDEMPRDWLRQELFPLTSRRRPRPVAVP